MNIKVGTSVILAVLKNCRKFFKWDSCSNNIIFSPTQVFFIMVCKENTNYSF